MPVSVTLKVLNANGHDMMAKILEMTLLFTFLFLLSINFCAHYYLNRVEKKITKKANILSNYSLFLKEIDRFENLDSVTKMMQEKCLNLEVRELFTLAKTSNCEEALD
jgi:hypothetical protein